MWCVPPLMLGASLTLMTSAPIGITWFAGRYNGHFGTHEIGHFGTQSEIGHFGTQKGHFGTQNQ